MMTVALMILAFVTGYLLGEWATLRDGAKHDSFRQKIAPPAPDGIVWKCPRCSYYVRGGNCCPVCIIPVYTEKEIAAMEATKVDREAYYQQKKNEPAGASGRIEEVVRWNEKDKKK